MSAPAPRLATYEDLRGLPDTVVGEIVGGQLVTSPRPSGRHSYAATGLTISLGSRFHFDEGGPGGWTLLQEPELHLDGDILVPDLAGWRRERMPTAPAEPAIDVAPDWVCEILSPSTARADRVQKMPAYARHGVRYLWLLDPITQTLEVFSLESGHWLLLANHGGNEVVRAVPFDAVQLRLDRLWA